MAASLPSFELPSSTNVVDVRVIDSTARLRIPMTTFVKDHVPGHDFLECPAYSFLIEHPSGQKLIFDLGLRKDIGASPPAILQSFVAESEKSGASVTVDTDVASILKEASIDLNDIKAIIWRYVESFTCKLKDYLHLCSSVIGILTILETPQHFPPRLLWLLAQGLKTFFCPVILQTLKD
jgi:hypothetical protein